MLFRSGGGIWQTGSYDPETNLYIVGTGNPYPAYDAEFRPGDNLYTNSIIALKPETGEIAWHYQTIPNDVWDYDAAFEQILADISVNGRPHKVLIHPGKNGYVYVLDRTNGKFITAFKYVDNVTWTSGLDENGRPIEKLLAEGQPVLVQVVKEPLGTKGARLTSHVTMAGRFLVFMPTVDHVGVSRKIESRDERSRLRGIDRKSTL